MLHGRYLLIGSPLVILLTLNILTVPGITDQTQAASDGPLLRDTPYKLPQDPAVYLNNMMSGGPPKDGIPSIDNPRFITAEQASGDLLQPGDIIIGYEKNGDARAYPQKIVVQHEIVNDRVGGENVSITYCPLTATAQGFKRGSSTLGVSGRLINSNLVMYDRATDSFYPQILGTGIKGRHKGKSLEEFNVVWTTWKRWKQKYPETKVLSTETGYLRSYTRDPYGGYNPREGYYRTERTMFPLMNPATNHKNKTMVLGARTENNSVYVTMKELRNQRTIRTKNFLIVYDAELDTGYIYSRDNGSTVKDLGGNRYKSNGDVYEASELPLEQHVSIEGFYFAWNAYFPDSETT